VKRILSALALLFAASLTLASSTTTPTSTIKTGQYILHKPDNTVPAPFNATTARFNSLEECQKAAESIRLAGGYKCDTSIAVTVTMVTTSTCADEKAPKLYLAQVTGEDGRKYWEVPAAGFIEPDYVEVAELYVHNPSWPAGYPNCWVRGQALRAEWRVNGATEPGKVFMERLEPGMSTADLWPDESIEEPVSFTPELQAAWDASCAERHARHVYYPEDTCS